MIHVQQFNKTDINNNLKLFLDAIQRQAVTSFQAVSRLIGLLISAKHLI